MFFFGFLQTVSIKYKHRGLIEFQLLFAFYLDVAARSVLNRCRRQSLPRSVPEISFISNEIVISFYFIRTVVHKRRRNTIKSTVFFIFFLRRSIDDNLKYYVFYRLRSTVSTYLLIFKRTRKKKKMKKKVVSRLIFN